MTKYYVFPLTGNNILLSVKSADNPRTGLPNYLASLPNPIGGNDDHRTALATIQAEAAEETYGKVAIHGIAGPFYRGVHHGNLDFYISTAFTYTPLAVLTGEQVTAINYANGQWRHDFPSACHGRCGTHVRHLCGYCSYLDLHNIGLTLLENTGEVATLDLLDVDSDSNHEAAQSVHSNVQGVAALAPISADFIGSHSIQAIRKLAAWVRYCDEVKDVKDEVARARLHANIRHMAPHAPTVGPGFVAFNIARTQLQLNAAAVNVYMPAAWPALLSSTDNMLADIEDIIVCYGLLDQYRKNSQLAAPPVARVGRSNFVTRLIDVITHLRAAESQLI